MTIQVTDTGDILKNSITGEIVKECCCEEEEEAVACPTDCTGCPNFTITVTSNQAGVNCANPTVKCPIMDVVNLACNRGAGTSCSWSGFIGGNSIVINCKTTPHCVGETVQDYWLMAMQNSAGCIQEFIAPASACPPTPGSAWTQRAAPPGCSTGLCNNSNLTIV